MRLKTLLPCSLAMFMLACSDDKSPTGPSGTGKEPLLTGSHWKMTAHTITPGVDYAEDGILVTDLFAAEGGCGHDDVDAYTADHRFVIDEGPTKCDPSDPQQEKGSWSLNAAGDTLTIHSDLEAGPSKFKVTELSAGKLSISSSVDDWGDGVVHTEVLTFSPI